MGTKNKTTQTGPTPRARHTSNSSQSEQSKQSTSSRASESRPTPVQSVKKEIAPGDAPPESASAGRSSDLGTSRSSAGQPSMSTAESRDNDVVKKLDTILLELQRLEDVAKQTQYNQQHTFKVLSDLKRRTIEIMELSKAEKELVKLKEKFTYESALLELRRIQMGRELDKQVAKLIKNNPTLEKLLRKSQTQS